MPRAEPVTAAAQASAPILGTPRRLKQTGRRLRIRRHARRSGGNSRSIAQSTAFRLAAIYTALFLTSFLIAGTFAYNMIGDYLAQRLDSHVMERFREIEAAYAGNGIAGAAEMIGRHGPAIRGQETVYDLSSANGAPIAGNVRVPPTAPGFSNWGLSAPDGKTFGYRLFHAPLGVNDLVVGVSYDDTERLREIALVSFGWATAIMLVAGLGGGTLLAFRTRRRIALMSRSAHAVGAGALATRLPVSGRGDDIDLFASEINVALDQLEASVNAMRQVTTDVAHDLKTPISRLYLALEDALAVAGEDSAAAPMLQDALQEVTLITRTFDALLRISQIEAGARKSRFTTVDLAPVIDELHEIYAPIVEDSGRSLKLLGCDRRGLLHVVGDAELVRQMCANILDNAIRHTPSGSTISMSCASDGQRVVLSIADDGPGIPPAEWTKVFKRFYRLEKSRTTAGTGLGLSLVKAIGDLHGASIRLEDNNPGLIVRIAFARVSRSDGFG